MYGSGVKVLEYHRDESLIDLDPFFQDLFYERDKRLGKPEVYERYKTHGDVTRYSFEIIELMEVVMANYIPNEFASFMESINEGPLEDRINELSDILTKVMAIVVSAIDDLTQRMSVIEQTLQTNSTNYTAIKASVDKITTVLTANPQALQQGPLLGKPEGNPPPPPPPPKPKPKPMSPLSARSAINSELKALFSKRRG